MQSDAVVFIKYFDNGIGKYHSQLFATIAVRHTVVMFVFTEIDMIVKLGFQALKCSDFILLGWQFVERVFFKIFKQLLP